METRNIFILTDNEKIKEVFNDTLIPPQFNTAFIENGKSLAETTKEFATDAVFIDFDFPEFKNPDSLLDLISELSDIAGYYTIVVMASRIPRIVYETMREKGAVNFIRTPFIGDALKQKVEQVISLKEYHTLVMDRAAEYVGFSVEHYIEQPLTAILGATKMLKLMHDSGESYDETELSGLIDIIIEGSDELSSIVKKFGHIKKFKKSDIFKNKKIIDLSGIEEKIIAEGEIELF
jgi:CheY-like chemotaxis protein